MDLSYRKKIIVAIGAFFFLAAGYRIVAHQELRPTSKSPVHVHESKEKQVYEQRKAQAIPEKSLPMLSPEQKLELDNIKANPLIHNGPTYVDQVAITFDDGPDSTFTPKILDIVKEHNVVATFFVQGNHVKVYPEILKRINEEGHTIGNHSYNHPQFTKLANTQIDWQVTRTEEEIKKVIGKKPTLFRAPYGDVNKKVVSQIKRKGYKLIQWNIDTNDWRGRSAKNIIATVQKNLKPGSIILQHSNGTKVQGTIEALPSMIMDLKRKGYQFVTVDQMLDIPPYR